MAAFAVLAMYVSWPGLLIALLLLTLRQIGPQVLRRPLGVVAVLMALPFACGCFALCFDGCNRALWGDSEFHEPGLFGTLRDP